MPEPRSPFRIEVDCYAGYRGEETPRRLRLGGRSIEVIELLDCWLAPDHRYFKLRGDDRALYIVRHQVTGDSWELTLYEAPPGGRTEGG
ncbi:MAG: hypothetical protein IH614_03730 [Desulfuromonadales bacterium]|nr:hypothetical protein [Desulfuromonadales bacterium]